MQTTNSIPGLMSIGQVISVTTLSKNTIYRLIKRGQFPRPLKIGAQKVAWREDEISALINGAKAVRAGGRP